MSAINVNSITGRTGSHGPVLTGVTTISGDLHVGSGLSVTGVSTFSNTVVGGATTELVVGGDTRITGILTIGTGSVTIDGTSGSSSITGVTTAGITSAYLNSVIIGTGVSIGSPANNELGLYTNSTERLRITGVGGSVGIGTDSPTTLLEVGNQTTSTAAGLTISRGEAITGGTGPVITLKHGPNGGTQRTHQIYSNVGNLRIVADSNEDLELWSGGAERFKINSNGDIATGSDAALSRLLMVSMCYARLVSHSGCNSAGPSGTFTEFDNGENSFVTVQGTVTAATSGYTFVGNGDGKALGMFVGCGDNPVFGWQDKDSNAPSYWSWVLVDSQFVSAVFGLPTNTTRTSLP